METTLARPSRSMAEIIAANEGAGGHWFEPETLRFFGSEIGRDTVAVSAGWVFVTREESPCGGKAWTARLAKDSGDVATLGEFHAHHTAHDAWEAAAEVLRATDVSGADACEAMAGKTKGATLRKGELPTDAGTFAKRLARAFPNLADSGAVARRLIGKAKLLNRLAEQMCGDGSHNQAEKAAWAESRWDIETDAVAELLRAWGIEAEINGDPRGPVLKLRVPSGLGDSFESRELLCVPCET